MPQSVTISGFSINIVPVPPPPLVPSPSVGSALPDEQVGQPIQIQLAQVSGGINPKTVTVSAGSLPAGLSITQQVNQITGVSTFYLSGIPTTPESSSFGITVTDSAP